MQRKAIIIGATGRIGQTLVRELSSLYATVIVISRTPPKYISENTHVYTLSDFDNLQQTLSATSLDAETDAFCCLSAKHDETSPEALEKIYHSYPKAFAKACHDKGVRRFFFAVHDRKIHLCRHIAPRIDHARLANADGVFGG